MVDGFFDTAFSSYHPFVPDLNGSQFESLAQFAESVKTDNNFPYHYFLVPKGTLTSPLLGYPEPPSDCLNRIVQAAQQPPGRTKSIFTVIRGTGGGKSRLLEELRFAGLKAQQHSVLVLAATFNHLWSSNLPILNNQYLFNPEFHLALAVVIRMASVFYARSPEDITTAIQGLPPLSSGCAVIQAFVHHAARKLGPHIKTVVVVVDESVRACQEVIDRYALPRRTDAMHVVRAALLDYKVGDLNVSLVISGLDTSPIGADLQTGSQRPLSAIHLPHALEPSQVVTKWWGISESTVTQEIFRYFLLIAASLCQLPRAIEQAAKEIKQQNWTPETVHGFYKAVRVNFPSHYTTRWPDSSIVRAMIFGDSIDLSMEESSWKVWQLIRDSFITNPVEDLKARSLVPEAAAIMLLAAADKTINTTKQLPSRLVQILNFDAISLAGQVFESMTHNVLIARLIAHADDCDGVTNCTMTLPRLLGVNLNNLVDLDSICRNNFPEFSELHVLPPSSMASGRDFWRTLSNLAASQVDESQIVCRADESESFDLVILVLSQPMFLILIRFHDSDNCGYPPLFPMEPENNNCVAADFRNDAMFDAVIKNHRFVSVTMRPSANAATFGDWYTNQAAKSGSPYKLQELTGLDHLRPSGFEDVSLPPLTSWKAGSLPKLPSVYNKPDKFFEQLRGLKSAKFGGLYVCQSSKNQAFDELLVIWPPGSTPFLVFIDCKSTLEVLEPGVTQDTLKTVLWDPDMKQYNNLLHIQSLAVKTVEASPSDNPDECPLTAFANGRFLFVYLTCDPGVSYMNGHVLVLKRDQTIRLFGPFWHLFRAASSTFGQQERTLSSDCT
jgi:hypothetical protein